MNNVKLYHVGDKGLQEGEALGRISVVLKADYEIELKRLRTACEKEFESVQMLDNELTKARELLGELVSIGTLYRDCSERIVFEPSREIHVKDGMEVFSRPHRPVVLPGRIQWYDDNSDRRKAEIDGWNACIDEFERLNK